MAKTLGARLLCSLTICQGFSMIIAIIISVAVTFTGLVYWAIDEQARDSIPFVCIGMGLFINVLAMAVNQL